MTTTALISDSQWRQIRQKAELPQFAAALRLLRHEVADFIARPVDAPQLPGGYYHDYFCPRHAVQLIFEPDSPRVHRCPVDGETFSGEPFDSAWRWSVNDRLAQSALRLAVLWKLEGEEEYRRRVEEILLSYAANYAGYMTSAGRPPNHGIAQYSTLDEAVWVIPLAWAFDLVRATLPPSRQTEIVERVLFPAADFLTERHFGGIHNFACWHNAAIGTIGAATGRDDLLAFAINGAFGFHTQTREGILADGLWFEGSFSYHFYTVAALLSLAKATANLPEWDLRRHPALAAVLRAPVLCAYPDGSLPATNDCWYFTGLIDDCCHGVPKAPAFYEIGHAWFDDALFGQTLARAYPQPTARDSLDALLFGAHAVPSEGVPALPSVHMAASGYAILRSQPEEGERPAPESEQYVLLKYGPHGGGHGHPDKLGLILHAQGSRQGPDLGTPGYGIDLFEGWYRQTISHNTAALDGLTQPPGAGRINAFRAGGPFQIADATMEWAAAAPSADAPIDGIGRETLDTYAHVKMRRAALARADYVVDIFLVDAGAARRIDWIYRNAGALAPPAASRPLGGGGLEGEGYEHITDLYSSSLDDDTTVTWQLGGSAMKLFMAEQAGTILYAGSAPGNPAEERQGLIIRRRAATRTAFLAIFHPYRERPRISSVTWHGRDLLGAGWAACTLDGAQGRDRWIIRLRAEVEIPSWLTGLPADNRFEYTLES